MQTLYIVLCACLMAIVSASVVPMGSNEELSDDERLQLECMKEHNMTREEFEDIRSEKIKLEDVGHQAKCTLHCIMMKENIVDGMGKFRIEDFKKKYPRIAQEQLVQEMVTCGSDLGPDACENAYNFAFCVYKKSRNDH